MRNEVPTTKKLNNNHVIRILSCAKKIKSINFLGNKCNKCGENDIHKLCFHHIDSNTKEIEINRAKYRRWSVIEKELSKCILLCHNCHMEHHFSTDSTDMRFKINKKIFLEYKGMSCHECGYDKCNESLHFHHLVDKKFTLAKVSIHLKTIGDLNKHILDELDKCIVLCANCHYKLHTDINFYESYKSEILSKIDNMKECQSKIDRELIHKLYTQDKLSISDISKKIDADDSTISRIIYKLGIKTNIKNEIINLYNSGLSKNEISKKLNINYHKVIYHIKNQSKA